MLLDYRRASAFLARAEDISCSSPFSFHAARTKRLYGSLLIPLLSARHLYGAYCTYKYTSAPISSHCLVMGAWSPTDWISQFFAAGGSRTSRRLSPAACLFEVISTGFFARAYAGNGHRRQCGPISVCVDFAALRKPPARHDAALPRRLKISAEAETRSFAFVF